ncbi:porin [Escherichia coli]|uniref:porin n=2 Tax=Escherichia coli TaxID=562 RepID=UPI00201C2E1D|nr:porin [Escherichia coli]MCL5641892.1 porin [Escherichia coli]
MKKLTVAISAVAASVLMAMSAQAAEIYNKDSNKLDLYGKVNAKHYFSSNDADDGDTTYVRLGFKGETQINDQLTGFGQWEYEFKGNRAESQGSSKDKTRLAFAGLKFGDYGSIDYGRNYGVAYDIGAWTDVLPEFGGDTWTQTDVFMTGRTTGVATYRNTDFFGMVEGLNFALQYQGKNEGTGNYKANGDGHGLSATYTIDGFSFAGAYANSDRTDWQSGDGKGERAEVWALSTKYDANNVYAAVMYGESHNMNSDDGDVVNKTQNFEAVLQYQFDFGLRPSIGYSYSKALDVAGYKDSDRLNYIEIGTWYYFNKNMNVYTAYQINLLDKSDYVLAHGLNTDDQLAVGIVYQF